MIIKRLIATAIILAGGTALGNTVSAEPADSTSLWKYRHPDYARIGTAYQIFVVVVGVADRYAMIAVHAAHMSWA